MSETDTQVVRRLALVDLRLDPHNPRLPPDFDASAASQDEIAVYINKHYDPLRIAESIEEHRFFDSEPLIGVAKDDHYVVIEGNRRLTALLGLTYPDLREQFARENRGWSRLTGENVPTHIPVLVVSKSQDVAALLGYRHISGIEPWDPYAQARYIAQLINRDGYSLEQVAELVGRKKSEVASKYRDFDILRQADELGIDTRRARQAFGVFNNAMGRLAVRKYIGAPDPRVVNPDFWPLEDGSKDKLALLLRIIFGDRRGQGRVITDSRQLGELAKVLADDTGRALRVLLATSDLSDALDATQDPDDQFLRAVRRAQEQLQKAASLEPESVSTSTVNALQHIKRSAETLIGRHYVSGEQE